ncbi:cysteine-rich receptor-like protein kinase 10 isoform X2 [Zingiber officinale]|uniref:cysteine-rich receptor-like protein kinase 10 isoform X2 n=1 Tax=Zingiber officinale TaxID=94328 RepID=UPI001C4DC938|nr:cysteine-rich receptor-like protein kinase 10 isoform X2 [Zingiber officinale]
MARSQKFLKSLIEHFFDGTEEGKEKEKEREREEEDLEAIASKERRVFRYEVLVAATRKFSPKNKLGEGGFGPVFRGRLEDGREVAVKRLGQASRQGTREFMNEAMLLAKVQHKNLVNLYGYCARGNDKLLVYEYVCNESLDKILFSREPNDGKKALLDWSRRFQVIAGVARGLMYLHEDAHTTIIHRDIKASNILLDEEWAPKIADFGMARLFPAEQTQVKTRVVGTNGYMAPEYVMHGSLSTKVDVFSFGVVLLELISGRKNASFAHLPEPHARSLLEWAWRLHRNGRSLELLDPSLKSAAFDGAEQVELCVHLGLLCVQCDPKLRPAMNRVVLVLTKRPRVLEDPTRPGMLFPRHRRHRGEAAACSSSPNPSSAESSATACATPNRLSLHKQPHTVQL